MKYAKKVLNINQKDNYTEVITDSNKIRIYFVEDEILRFVSSFDDQFENKSYSLIQTQEEDYFDEDLKDERTCKKTLKAKLIHKKKAFVLKGKKLIVEIEKEPFQINIYDSLLHLLHSDVIDLGYMFDNNNRNIHTFEIFQGDHFYGFGEKSGNIDKLHEFLTMNAGDTFGYDPIHSDGLYKHIPFFIRLNEKSKKACGYFYNTASECDFDIGRKYSNYWKHKLTFRNNNGPVDYFFIQGPKITDIIKRFTDLTGKSILLPRYSLGYLGSSMIYAELPFKCDAGIEKFINKAIQQEIPIDGFQLSSGYTRIGRKRYVFTWNKKRFPNPKKFIEKMNQKGISVSPNVKPGILLTHPYYKQMEKEKIFIKDEDGKTNVGKWWGGEGSFVDFTDKNARDIWKKYLKKYLLDYGIESIWNDNCEYEGVFQDDAMCKAGKIATLRPIMANIMCKLTIEAIEESYPNVRPFVVCRAGHTGIQRYAQTWSGDNYTSWDSLKYNIATMLGMGISGVSNYGSDVGGFAGPAPEPELLLRFVQCGIFEQRFSIHSVNDDLSVTEPWMYPEIADKIKDAIQLRYKLTPYYYSLMYRAFKFGLPMMNSLFAIFQEDTNTYRNGCDFMVGDFLLVSPIVEKGQTTKQIALPKGKDFVDFWNRTFYKGGQTISIDVNLDCIPMYLRSGSILPISNTKLFNLHQNNLQELCFICFPDKKESHFTYYDDDGYSKDYQKGIVHLEEITMRKNKDISITNKIAGSYEVPYKSVLYDIICEKPKKVTYQKEVLKLCKKEEFDSLFHVYYYDEKTSSIKIRLEKQTSSYTLCIHY